MQTPMIINDGQRANSKAFWSKQVLKGSRYLQWGIVAVVYDLLHAAANRSANQGAFSNRVARRLLKVLGNTALRLDRKFSHNTSFITTGYSVVVSKAELNR